MGNRRMKYTIKYIEKILDDNLKTFKKNDFKKRASKCTTNAYACDLINDNCQY